MKVQPDKSIEEEVKIFSALKKHIAIYATLMLISWVTSFAFTGEIQVWLIYITVAWGLVVLLHYIGAYLAFRKRNK